MGVSTTRLTIYCLLASVINAYPSPQPLIGIIMQKTAEPASYKGQYVMTDYKSFIEQGGGGAVPIFVDQPDEYYEKLIRRLNGVLMPGGGIDHVINSPFGKVSAMIFKMAMEMNDAGTHFPIWGTCQGFEDMTTWPFKPMKSPLTKCTKTFGVSLPVNFTTSAGKSKLFGSLTEQLHNIMSKENVTPNFHSLCLSMDTYTASTELNTFYDVLSTNVDGRGLRFVSSFESRKYPFYGVQWHPEKINFLHSFGISINQSPDAILVSQFFGNFLVQEAKKNRNSFHSRAEEARFVFNRYPTTFNSVEFEEIYCLNKTDLPHFDF